MDTNKQIYNTSGGNKYYGDKENWRKKDKVTE